MKRQLYCLFISPNPHQFLSHFHLLRMNPLRSSCPAEYGCTAIFRNWLMSSGRSNMLMPEHVFLAVKPVDMYRGIDTLTQYVQDELKSPWHEGAALLPSPIRIKVLCWDKHGIWLCVRRRYKGSFRWPRANDVAWVLTTDEFSWLVSGVDWQQVICRGGTPRSRKTHSALRTDPGLYSSPADGVGSGINSTGSIVGDDKDSTVAGRRRDIRRSFCQRRSHLKLTLSMTPFLRAI